jgi:cytochrome c oxidase cbb3-type subunit IV
MTYEWIRTLSGTAGLVIFIALFAAVLIYVFKPGNKRKFDHASRMPLQDDPKSTTLGEKNGR